MCKNKFSRVPKTFNSLTLTTYSSLKCKVLHSQSHTVAELLYIHFHCAASSFVKLCFSAVVPGPTICSAGAAAACAAFYALTEFLSEISACSSSSIRVFAYAILCLLQISLRYLQYSELKHINHSQYLQLNCKHTQPYYVHAFITCALVVLPRSLLSFV